MRLWNTTDDEWDEYGPEGGQPGRLLAYKTYSPASDGATYTTTNTSLGDVDATNLVISFVVPASGAVIIELNATAREPGGNNVFWGLREGTTQVGLQTQAGGGIGASAAPERTHAVLVVTGLTPGVTKTYKWGWRVDAGTGAMWLGPNRGPATMMVFDSAVSPGQPQERSFLGARANRSSVLSVGNASWTAVGFNAEDYDVGTFHDNTTNPSRFTVPQAGYYRVTALPLWQANSSGVRYRAIAKNGTRIIAANQPAANNATNGFGHIISDIVLCAVSDYLELHVYQDSGGALDLSTGSYMVVEFVGA